MRHSENLEITCFDFCFCLLFACLLKIDESFEMKIRDLKNETSNEEEKINYSAERKNDQKNFKRDNRAISTHQRLIKG